MTTRPRDEPAPAAGDLPVGTGDRVRLILVLAGLSAAGPLATDMYVPGLPQMARSLHTDTAGAQVSLAGFLIGVIVGQLVWGPLSDAAGRRPVLLAGTSSFAVFSLVCALAPTAEVLDAARVGQGFTGAAGIVVARAVVSDLFDDSQLARVFSALGAITALGPVIAPLLGGALLAVASWRSVFVVLAVTGLLLTAGVLRELPETHHREARTKGGVAGSLRSVAGVARRPAVLAPVLAVGFGSAAVFAYIAGTSFVFQDVYHLTSASAGVVYGVNAVGNVAGSLAYGRLVRRWRAGALLTASGAAGLAASAALLAVQALAGGGVIVTWTCLFAAVTAFGVFFPAVTTVAQSRGRDAPGATSALMGSGQFAFGAAAAPTVGLFGTHSPLPMAAVMTACLSAALLAALLAAKPERHPAAGPRGASAPGAGR
ncbi:multidrug transporter CflA [Streptomyces abyssalis]|uniref:Multidrug transporter CflA n=1 Tax=Streptomyces abyssalis TaxID=933944 RepID=A0A1E7JI36_9ACTN|nr:multidrug effflux MFS transporter [Streptomyces abyssalis]OEU86129.1 multidrug transporter CflA [Streptomyces abyssalis]OEU92404.1 multidrug transporter CflA [Streptomyces abyssalis]